ncbi:MAG: IscS subfamily cysteine desulfurase [Alphaproteobacteria bacterium]
MNYCKKALKYPIYLDYQSTTPCDERVVEKMLPYFGDVFGNPHSLHTHGQMANEAIEKARESVATLINANPKEIIFTSGATEANNLAIKGVARFYKDKKKHIITCVTEHKCVIESCRALQKEGFLITYLPVLQNGLIDIEQLKEAIRNDTILVSIMAVNNEIGVVQPIKDIGKLCKNNGIFFHTDAAQAIGKTSIDVKEMNIDLLSLSGHKIYGPKGIGALYVNRNPRIHIKPIISGGGQERGMRSGTLPTHLCVGLGAACVIAQNEMQKENECIEELRNRLYQGITKELTHVYLNGDFKNRVPGNLNLSFACVEGESVMMSMKEISLSSGSACTSASLEPSYVLKALGVRNDLSHTSIRFSIGRFTTKEEIDYTIDKVVEVVNKLREMSPLWEMMQSGVDVSFVEWEK